MAITSNQFITQMKLRELREQRTTLLQGYTLLQRQLAEEPTQVGRLRLLYEGLRKIAFSHHPLHPDIANLEPLLDDLPTDQADQETISYWRARLEQELASGQLRSEMVYLFGALLEEWAHYHTESQQAFPHNDEQQEALIAASTHPAPVSINTTVLDPLFSMISSVNATFPLTMRKVVEDVFDELVSVEDLLNPLEFLSTDEDRAPALRQQADQFLHNEIMCKELADALSIQLMHLNEWAWPQEGVPTHLTETNDKWRLFLDDDFPNACFLEVLGKRWHEVMQRFFRALDQKLEERVQTIVSRDEKRIISHSRFATTLSLYEEIDIWDEKGTEQTYPPRPRLMQIPSISRTRATLKQQLHDVNRTAGYGRLSKRSAPDAMETALQLINAEIILARTAFPDRPLHVVKIDLKDYYPSLPHELLLNMLERYGVPPAHLAFFKTFLQVPLRHSGQVEQVQRGIPNSRLLSDFLGELVLRALDVFLQASARVQIVRLFDDICLLTPSASEALKAWNALEDFCQATGLAVNKEKCGAVCINGKPLPELPATQPDWLWLTIDLDGQWNVNMKAFTTYVQRVREEIQHIPALFSKIEAYNSHLLTLCRSLALRLPLGERHRTTVNHLLQEFQRDLFDEQQGGVETLRRLIGERFLGQSNPIHVPEAWFYWPVSAGGAGFYQVHILTSGYQAHFSRIKLPVPPENCPQNWQDQSLGWAHFYLGLFERLGVRAPDSNQTMETLVTDFIQRGASLSAGTQKDLAVYWRWVLYLYGPQILQSLGTFRFLITELVPLQLIMKRYQQTASVNSEETFLDADDLDDHPF